MFIRDTRAIEIQELEIGTQKSPVVGDLSISRSQTVRWIICSAVLLAGSGVRSAL